MSNQGQKYLAGQVQHLRAEIAKLKGLNFRLHNEVRVLQSVQFSILEPYFFKAFWEWFKKWRKYRES